MAVDSRWRLHLCMWCDATRMAKDVHDALVIVAEQEGKMPRDDAEQFINDLRKAKRYQRDVY